jgi:hypothetical protein
MRSTRGMRRSDKAGFAALLVAAAIGWPVDRAIAQCVIGGGTFTTCSSETRSETVVNTTVTTATTSSQVVVPGSGPLSSQLGQYINGPNGGAVLNAFTQVMGPGAVGQSSTTTSTTTSTTAPTGATSITVYTTFGPAGPHPVGPGPGTMNCNGAPPPPPTGGWPAANCDFTGYTLFNVAAGTTNVHTNTHFFFLTQVLTQISIVNQTQVNLTLQGFNWLTGDLHPTFQTTIHDDDFRFMDFLLGRGGLRGAGGGPSGANGAASMVPLGFAPEATVDQEPFRHALAYVGKAPRMLPPASPVGGWSAWARGNLGYARYDTSPANFGFDAKSRSAEVGVEYAREAWLLGAAAGFGRADVNQLVTGDSGRIDSVRTGLYGAFLPGDWRLSGAVAGGFHAIDATRLALLPGPARSRYDAHSISAGLEAARRLVVADHLIEPLAGLVYTALRVDAFREAGNGFLDLAGQSATIDALKGYVGARASRTWMIGTSTLTPEVRARVLHDFLDDPRGYTARFTADPTATAFAVSGLQPGRTAALLGAGVTAQVTPGWRAFAAYDAEIRRNAISHLGTAGVKVNW